MSIRIEVDRSEALPPRHMVRAFHGAGWVVTASWNKDQVQVTGLDGAPRDLRTSGLMALDVSANGDVLLLEPHPRGPMRTDGPPTRIRLVPRSGSASSVSAHAIRSLRFDSEFGGAVAFGPAGTAWLSGCDIRKEEGIWLGLVDLAKGKLVTSTTLPDPYPGQVWLHRGDSAESVLLYLGAGQHGQWQYLVSRRAGALVWRQLGSGDETSPASFAADGSQFTAAVDWSKPTLVIGRREDGAILRSVRLPYDNGGAVTAFDTGEQIVVAHPEPRLDVFDRETLEPAGSITLGHDLDGDTRFDAGRFVSVVNVGGERHWMMWRIVG